MDMDWELTLNFFLGGAPSASWNTNRHQNQRGTQPSANLKLGRAKLKLGRAKLKLGRAKLKLKLKLKLGG